MTSQFWGSRFLSVCILGHFPSEFRTRQLFTDRFVCVVREDHPQVGKRLTLNEYLALDHIVVSPLGRPSHVDSVLAERGLQRRIRRIVPFFLSGLLLAATTDSILTVSHRAAESMAATLHLRILEPPLPLSAYALNLLWHPRLENEPANQWLREVFVRAATEAAPESSRDAIGAAPGRGRTRKFR